MAIYEYLCPKCNQGFRVERPISKADELDRCPECGTTCTGIWLFTREKAQIRLFNYCQYAYMKNDYIDIKV